MIDRGAVRVGDDTFAERDVRREGTEERPLGPRGRETRSKVLNAAAKRFAADGYHGTTMADVAADAGVSLGAVYQYFRHRADLIAALVRSNVAQRLGVGDVGWSAADGRAGIERVLLNFVTNYAEAAPLAGVWEEVTHVEPRLADMRRNLGNQFTMAVADELRSAAARGQVRKGLDPDLAARALTGMADRFCYVTYVFDPPAKGPPSPESAAATLADLWAAAVGLREPD